MTVFAHWLAEKVGTAKWVVAARLTQRMRDKGYTLALTPKRYAELRNEYEGGPLESLLDETIDALTDCMDDLTSWATSGPEGMQPDERKRLDHYDQVLARLNRYRDHAHK